MRNTWGFVLIYVIIPTIYYYCSRSFICCLVSLTSLKNKWRNLVVELFVSDYYAQISRTLSKFMGSFYFFINRCAIRSWCIYSDIMFYWGYYDGRSYRLHLLTIVLEIHLLLKVPEQRKITDIFVLTLSYGYTLFMVITQYPCPHIHRQLSPNVISLFSHKRAITPYGRYAYLYLLIHAYLCTSKRGNSWRVPINGYTSLRIGIFI